MQFIQNMRDEECFVIETIEGKYTSFPCIYDCVLSKMYIICTCSWGVFLSILCACVQKSGLGMHCCSLTSLHVSALIIVWCVSVCWLVPQLSVQLLHLQ